MSGIDGGNGAGRKSADHLKAQQNSPRLPISVAAAEAGCNAAFETSCTDYARLNAGRCASARLDSFKPRPKTPEAHGRGGQRDTRTGPQLLNREALDVFEMGIARHLANHRQEVQDELREAREVLVTDVSKLLADTRGIRMLEVLDNKVDKIIRGPGVIDLTPAVERTEQAEQKLEQHFHELSVAMLKAFRESSESLRKEMQDWEQRQEKAADQRFREIMSSMEAKATESNALNNCSIDLVSKLQRGMDSSFEEVREMHREDQDFQAHAREERLKLHESSEKLHKFVETVASAVEVLRQNQEDIKASSADALEEFRIGREESRMYRSEILPRLQAELTNQFEMHAPKVDLKPMMRQLKVTQHMLGFNFPQLLGEVGRIQQALNVDFVPSVDLRLFGFPSLIGDLREVAGEKPMPILPYPSSSPLVITSSNYSPGGNGGTLRNSRASRSLTTSSALRPRRSARIASNIESPTSPRSRQSSRSNLSDAEEAASSLGDQSQLGLTKSMPVIGVGGDRRHSARPALGLKGRAFSLFGKQQSAAAAAAAATGSTSTSSAVVPLASSSSTRDSVNSSIVPVPSPGNSPVTKEDPPEIPLQDSPAVPTYASSSSVGGGVLAAARAVSRAASTMSSGRGGRRNSSLVAALFLSNHSNASATSGGSGDAAAAATASRDTFQGSGSRGSSKSSSINASESSSASDKMCASNGEPVPPPPPEKRAHPSLGSLGALFSAATNAATASERHSISSATLAPPSAEEANASRGNEKRLSSSSSNAGGGSNRGSMLSVTFNIAKAERNSQGSAGSAADQSENSEDLHSQNDDDDDDDDAEEERPAGASGLRGSSSSSLESYHSSNSRQPHQDHGDHTGDAGTNSGKLRPTPGGVHHRASQPAVPTSEIPIVLRRQTSADLTNPHTLLHPQWAVSRSNRGPSDGSPPRTVTPPALLMDSAQGGSGAGAGAGAGASSSSSSLGSQPPPPLPPQGTLQPPTLPIRTDVRSNSLASSNGSPDGEERLVATQTTVQLRDFSSTAFDYLGQHGSDGVQDPGSQKFADNIPGQVELEEALWSDDGALAGKQGAAAAAAQTTDVGTSTEGAQAAGSSSGTGHDADGGPAGATTAIVAAPAIAAGDDGAQREGGGEGVDKGTGPDKPSDHEVPSRTESPRKSMTYLQPPDGNKPRNSEEAHRFSPPPNIRNALLPDTAVVRRRHYWTQTDVRWANVSCQTDETGARNLVPEKEVKKANPTLMLDAPKKKEVKSFKNVLLDQDAMKQKAMAKMSRPQYNVQNFYHDKGWAQRVARSAAFEYCTLIVIALNALWIAIDIDYNDAQYLVEAHPIFQIGENLFCVYFTSEVLVRFCAFKRKAHAAKDFWFVFDSLLVTLMILETWVLTLVIMLSGSDVSAGLGGMSMLRIFRLVKLARVSRVARLLRSVPELLILVKGLKAASRSVVVFFIMWSLMIYIYALFLRMVDVESESLFATIPQTMNMLLLRGILPMHADFIFTSSTDNYFFWPILVSFIILAFVMLMNMLVGVSVEVITAVASTEREGITVLELATHLRDTLKELGFETEGYFTKDMISSFIEQPSIHAIVDRVGADLVAVLDLCTQQFEEREMEGLKFEELVEMIMSLRGTNNAKVKDVKALLRSIRSTMREVEHNLRVVLYEELNEIRQQMYDTMKAQAAMMQDRDRDTDDGALVRKDTIWSQ